MVNVVPRIYLDDMVELKDLFDMDIYIYIHGLIFCEYVDNMII